MLLVYGDNIAFNPQLANAISAATKGMPIITSIQTNSLLTAHLFIASIPKNLIEAAVARGQGRSTTGAQLEAITFEALMPPSIAIIADVETDNKTRTMHDLKYVVKKAGGISSSSAFYFARRGRSVFKAKDNGPALSDMLDEAIEHDGVEDVEDSPDGGFVMWTEPSVLMAVTEAFSKKFELEIAEADIVWAPNEDTKVGLDSDESAEALDTLLGGLKEYPEVKGLYINTHRGSLSQETWDKVERHIDA